MCSFSLLPVIQLICIISVYPILSSKMKLTRAIMRVTWLKVLSTTDTLVPTKEGSFMWSESFSFIATTRHRAWLPWLPCQPHAIDYKVDFKLFKVNVGYSYMWFPWIQEENVFLLYSILFFILNIELYHRYTYNKVFPVSTWDASVYFQYMYSANMLKESYLS